MFSINTKNVAALPISCINVYTLMIKQKNLCRLFSLLNMIHFLTI